MDAVSDLFTKRLKAPYDTYFGFDSFEGLPAEAAGVAMPPHGQWQPGQFSDVMQLSEGVKTKVDNLFKQHERAIHKIGSAVVPLPTNYNENDFPEHGIWSPLETYLKERYSSIVLVR